MNFYAPTPKQLSLMSMVKEVCNRHFALHGRWPSQCNVSEAWIDAFDEAAPPDTGVTLVVGGMPIVVNMSLRGVAVMTHERV